MNILSIYDVRYLVFAVYCVYIKVVLFTICAVTRASKQLFACSCITSRRDAVTMWVSGENAIILCEQLTIISLHNWSTLAINDSWAYRGDGYLSKQVFGAIYSFEVEAIRDGKYKLLFHCDIYERFPVQFMHSKWIARTIINFRCVFSDSSSCFIQSLLNFINHTVSRYYFPIFRSSMVFASNR